MKSSPLFGGGGDADLGAINLPTARAGRGFQSTISGVLARFLLAYVGLFIIVLVGFGLFRVKLNSGVNIAVMIGAATWPCLAFAEKNKLVVQLGTLSSMLQAKKLSQDEA